MTNIEIRPYLERLTERLWKKAQEVRQQDINDGKSFFSSFIFDKQEARQEASILLCQSLGLSKIDLRIKDSLSLSDAQANILEENIKRRENFEPLALIFGQKEFFSLDFCVNEHTLIPRPETECLVEEALNYLDKNTPALFLDLGCGTGCIALSILKHRPKAKAILVDISQEALNIARKNAINLELDKQAYFLCADFCQADFSANLQKFCSENQIDDDQYPYFDILVSNPPYIPSEEYELLGADVKNFEPKSALYSPDISKQDNCLAENEGKGIFHPAKVIERAKQLLKNEGLLLIEHGYNQGKVLRELCTDDNFNHVSTEKDYYGNGRFLKAFRKN